MANNAHCRGCTCSRVMTLRCLPKCIVFPELRVNEKRCEREKGDTDDKAWGGGRDQAI